MDASIISANRALLSEYDFYVLIDKSGSMGTPVKAGSTRTRWEAVQETATQFAREISAIDTDGIAVVMFGGSSIQGYENVTADKVAEVFASNRPSGSTPLAEALAEAFRLAGKSSKKDLIVVFTDGVPDEPNAVANAIKAQANKQSADDECTVLFVQVGDDQQAAAYLKGLDDNLRGAKFDIVDTKTMAEAEAFPTIEELLLAAIND